MNRLSRRVERLEQHAEAHQTLPCRDCGLGHVFEVLSLGRLSTLHRGASAPIPSICGCACCAAILCSLVARYELVA